MDCSNNSMKFKKISIIIYIILLLFIVLPIIEAKTIDNEKFGKNSLTQEEKENLGFYPGFIIGKIWNVDRSGDKITFYAISVTIFPGRYHLTQVDARLDIPYFGILTSKFICLLGIVYSGW